MLSWYVDSFMFSKNITKKLHFYIIHLIQKLEEHQGMITKIVPIIEYFIIIFEFWPKFGYHNHFEIMTEFDFFAVAGEI